MNKTCQRCNCLVPPPQLSHQALSELQYLILKKNRLFAVKHLMETYQLEHAAAKVLVAHWNTHFGHCHHCDFKGLDQELIDCPQGGAFNYNISLITE